MLIERCIVDDNMDVCRHIEVYIPDPELPAAIDERVVGANNKTWLPYNSRNLIPANATGNVCASSNFQFFCTMSNGTKHNLIVSRFE